MPAFDRITTKRPAVLYSIDYQHRKKLLLLATGECYKILARREGDAVALHRAEREAIERLYDHKGTEADLDVAIGLYARHGDDDHAQALRDTRGMTNAEHAQALRATRGTTDAALAAQKCRTPNCHRVGISTRGGYCVGCLARARR